MDFPNIGLRYLHTNPFVPDRPLLKQVHVMPLSAVAGKTLNCRKEQGIISLVLNLSDSTVGVKIKLPFRIHTMAVLQQAAAVS